MPMKVGDQVRSGRVVAEVSGRPVIVLPGRFPAYRELKSNDEGPDVRQLQQALRPRYGTPITGKFDPRTASDLRRLYKSIGYPAPTVEPSGEQKSDRAAPQGEARGAGEVTVAPKDTLRVPAGELFFVSELPATVGLVQAGVGGDGGGPLLTLTSGGWQLLVRLDDSTQQLLESMPQGGRFRLDGEEGVALRLVEIRADGDGGSATAAPGAQEPSPQPSTERAGDGPPNAEHKAVFAVTGTPKDAVVGQTRDIIVERGRSSTKAVVVPASAVWTAADGTVAVEAMADDGSTRKIEVEVLLSVRGRVAVRPTQGELPAGTKVVVAERDGEPVR
ncbi:hypothetical protein [Micromonospora lupini]|uniref:hypothetical protein n=1 Tax=Micromonospora lupini TaxID=285679 RepID=UPI0033F89356